MLLAKSILLGLLAQEIVLLVKYMVRRRCRE